MVLAAFCGEGDRVAMPHPTYSLYETLVDIQDGEPVLVDFPEDYSLPPALAETEAELTLLCNPNAPSGTMVAPEAVARVAESLDGILLIDEAYVDFADTNCLDLVDTHDNVVVARTMSKSYSLAGLRFGFAVAQEHLIEGLTKVKDSYNVGRLQIAGASAAMADQDWFANNIARIKNTRADLIAGLTELGFHCWPSQTNFVLARVPEGCSGRDIFQGLFDRKVLVRYFGVPMLDDCLRITVGSDAEVAVLLDKVASLLA